MADPETKKKIERYRQFRKDYGNHLFAVLMIVFVYAMLTDRDIMDYLHLLRKLLRELRQDREKRE